MPIGRLLITGAGMAVKGLGKAFKKAMKKKKSSGPGLSDYYYKPTKKRPTVLSKHYYKKTKDRPTVLSKYYKKKKT